MIKVDIDRSPNELVDIDKKFPSGTSLVLSMGSLGYEKRPVSGGESVVGI